MSVKNLTYIKIMQLSVLIFMLLSQAVLAEASENSSIKKSVLMVVSGHGSASPTSHNGYEFDEFAKAYIVFQSNNVKVDIASPQGGKVNASRFDPHVSFNQTLLNDTVAMNKLAKSLAFNEVEASNYDAVFIVGGNGVMYDLPNNQNLQELIKDIYENKGSIAAVCHGPAALVNVRLNNGKYLVENRTLNSFTNQEEKILNDDESKHFAFLIENKLKQRGATFKAASLLMPFSVTDERLITGQNQHSTGDTAVNLLRSIGVKDIKYPSFKDEASMMLVQRFLSGDDSAITDFHHNIELYIPKLIAMYAKMLANTTQELQVIEKSVVLMEMVFAHWHHPKLSLALAKSLIKLDRLTQAKSVLTTLLERHPEHKKVTSKAQKLLDKISSQAHTSNT